MTMSYRAHPRAVHPRFGKHDHVIDRIVSLDHVATAPLDEKIDRRVGERRPEIRENGRR